MRLLLILCAIVALLPAPTAAVPSAPQELRAFWVDAFNNGFKTAAQVAQLVDDAARANANTLIVQVRRRGDTYYQSDIEPRAQDPALAPPPYDALVTLLAAAHARGLQVHAWIATLPVWQTSMGAPPAGHVLQTHGAGAPGDADWVMRDADGASADSSGTIWLDPGHPAVVAYTESVVRELLTRYPGLDGIHLDRIRYPGTSFGYNSTAVARFNARYGRSGTPAPSDPLWSAWRREQVTALVRRIALAAAEVAPHARVSAATIAWGDGPNQVGGWEHSAPYQQVLQDWRGWLQQKLLDTAVVMNYDREHEPSQRAYFDDWLAWETISAGGEVVAGSAAYLNSIDGTLAQVARVQASPAHGAALYSYATTNKDGQPRSALLDALAAGPFAAPATVPFMPWKDERGALHGTLDGVQGLASTDGVAVLLSGPEVRALTSDGAGWFGAPGLAPGEYVALVGLDGDHLARASASVAAGSVANVGGWEVIELPWKGYLPLIVQ